MRISSLLLDNIDTLNAIAKGRAWQQAWQKWNTRYDFDWEDPIESCCPIHSLANNYAIRLAPKKKWVDFSHAPEKRPKMAILEKRITGSLFLFVFREPSGCWVMGGHWNAWTDSELFADYDWHHEDGTVTPFGVEVEG
jgi:hypothetical protein